MIFVHIVWGGRDSHRDFPAWKVPEDRRQRCLPLPGKKLTEWALKTWGISGEVPQELAVERTQT